MHILFFGLIIAFLNLLMALYLTGAFLKADNSKTTAFLFNDRRYLSFSQKNY